MPLFDELSVNVSADTASFSAGMNSVESTLNDVSDEALQSAGSMQILQNRLDETQSESTSLTASLFGTSGALSGLSSSASSSSVSLSGLSSVLLVSVVPALLATTTALVPVVTALGGLATVLGSIGLVGFVGAIGAVTTNTEALQQTWKDIQSTLESELAPLFDAFTGVLNSVGQAFVSVISEIAPTETQISSLASGFEELGITLVNALPPLITLATELATQFLPAATALAEDVLPAIPGFLNTLVSTFERLIPEFEAFATTLVAIGPPLLEFGFTALNVVAPALARLGDGIITVLEFANSLDERLAQLAISLGSVVPVLAGIATILGGPLTVGIAGVIASLTIFRDETEALIAAVIEFGEDALGTVVGFIDDLSLDGLVESVQSLGGQLSETAGTIQDTFLSIFTQFVDAIQHNRAPITNFGQTVVDAFTGVIDVLGALQPAVRFALETVLLPIVSQAIALFQNQLGPTLDDISSAINNWGIILREVGGALQSFYNQNQSIIIPTLEFLADVIGMTVVNAFDALLTTIRIVAELISGDLGGAFDEAVGLGQRFFTRFNSLLDDWNVVEAFTNIIGSIVDALVTFHTATLPGLFLVGMADALGLVTNQLIEIENAFISTFNSIVESVAMLMTELVNIGIIDPLNSVISTITSVIDQLPDDVQSELPSSVQNLAQQAELETPDVSSATLATTATTVQQEQQQAAQDIAANLNIDISGNGELAEVIRNNAELTIESQASRAERLGQRGN